MKIYACSDLHVSPIHFSNRAKLFLEEAVREAGLTLLCGDIYEGIWYELEESVNSPNGQELWSFIKGLPRAVILEGNHDWTLGEYLPADKDHWVEKSYEFEADGKKYYATHGWVEYDLTLSPLAPIYRWLFRLLPKLTKYWPRRQTPSEMKKEAQQSKSLAKIYWRHVRAMSNQAIFQAIAEDCIPIWGHSHRRHIDAYENWRSINCGDFCKDEYGDDIGGIIIEDGVVREWTPAS
jgi:UDP-2,3-diacylglucosamine pyrophosphatase LpxH